MFELVSFNLCPFVQRSVITLIEKNVPHEITYIDLDAKPDWFLSISPLGKVPLLKTGSDVLFESAVINEFLDEVTPGRRLLPQDPLEKAKMRAWIEFSSVLAMDQYLLSTAASEGPYREKARAVAEKLDRLEAVLGHGPLFNGESFSLLDAAVAPVLQRLWWCQEMDPALAFFNPGNGDRRGISRWASTLLARPSVIRSTVPEIRSLFIAYVRKKGAYTSGLG